MKNTIAQISHQQNMYLNAVYKRSTLTQHIRNGNHVT